MLYYDDGQATLYLGDVRDCLSELPSNSVHCVVTSPPYWNQRDYGLPPAVWGGDSGCAHTWETESRVRRTSDSHPGAIQATSPGSLGRDVPSKSNLCSLCGGWQGSLGLEPTPDCGRLLYRSQLCGSCYVCHLVEVFREVRRVLRDDGTCFVNLGDSYYGSGGAHADHHANDGLSRSRLRDGVPATGRDERLAAGGLVGIPWRAAFALQADGWRLRSAVIWAKDAPMPESIQSTRWEQHQVKIGNRGRSQSRLAGHFQDHSGNLVFPDAQWEPCPGCVTCAPNDGLVLRRGSWRSTTSYDYIFQLTGPGPYYGDGEAVKEEQSAATLAIGTRHADLPKAGKMGEVRNNRSFTEATRFADVGGRNPRDVWRLKSNHFTGEHFAIFPLALPTRCILASTSEHGVCSACGAPWARVIQKEMRSVWHHSEDYLEYGKGQHDGGPPRSPYPLPVTTGWRATCACSGAGALPAVVLDPFVGSGTTSLAARKLGRRSIGIDLSEAYLKMAIPRLHQLALA